MRCECEKAVRFILNTSNRSNEKKSMNVIGFQVGKMS